MLITSVIVRLEQRKKRKFTSTLFLFGANVSTQIDKEEADYEYNHSKYAWLEWDEASKVGKLLHIPERADIPENIKEHLIVELYSK